MYLLDLSHVSPMQASVMPLLIYLGIDPCVCIWLANAQCDVCIVSESMKELTYMCAQQGGTCNCVCYPVYRSR